LFKCHLEERDISIKLVYAAAYIIHLYGQTGKLDKAIEYCNYLEELRGKGCLYDRHISLRQISLRQISLRHIPLRQISLRQISLMLAKAAYDLTIAYSQIGKAERLCDKTLQSTKANHLNYILYNSRCKDYQKEIKFPMELSKAAYDLMSDRSESKETYSLISRHGYINNSWRSDYMTEKCILLPLAQARFSLMLSYIQSGEIDKTIEYYERIEDLWNSGFLKDWDISCVLAQATAVCSIIFGEKGEVSLSEQYRKKFMKLHKSLSESKDKADVCSVTRVNDLKAAINKYFIEKNKDK
jgi:tetratricopeptide (TPR) repeat protein